MRFMWFSHCTPSRSPLANFIDYKTPILSMKLDQIRGLWVTVGEDKIIRVRKLIEDGTVR